jgi:hypothetical protein
MCGSEYDLKSGCRIENWNLHAFLKSPSADRDGTPDDYLADPLGVPILSSRLRIALERNGVGISDIQYLPIRVFLSTGKEIHGYSIANILSRLPALNRAHSVLLDDDPEEIDPVTNAPTVRGLWRAALNGAPLVGHDVVRLVEFFPPVFVSERFAQVFSKGGFTGAALTPVLVY